MQERRPGSRRYCARAYNTVLVATCPQTLRGLQSVSMKSGGTGFDFAAGYMRKKPPPRIRLLRLIDWLELSIDCHRAPRG